MIKIYTSTEDRSLVIKEILSRCKNDNDNASLVVNEIISTVKTSGDEALIKYTKQFDKVNLTATEFLAAPDEISIAIEKAGEEFLNILQRAAKRIEAFHLKQKRISWFDWKENGEILGQLITPVESCGVYAPGGKAIYPSTVLMNVIPAKIAGVKKIVMVTPPGSDGNVAPEILAAAHVTGVNEIYKIGGAQAIAALAFGTETIPKVDKIVGPGNIYVALAKKSVFGEVSIDSVAGPSEIVVLADESANPILIAADLLSQAEHDEMASAILITTSEDLAKNVSLELEKQKNVLSRKEILQKSLDNYGAIIVVNTINQGLELVNQLAPEHLEIITKNPFEQLPKVKNAGAIFLGNYSPEPLGDYMAGPNHVLPTGGTARFFSPLSVDDFIKKSSIISFSKEAFENLSKDVIQFAKAEGLTAHANAISKRYEALL